jgi:tripartite-type tricarboxylate transporter receptor subunit TctC
MCESRAVLVLVSLLSVAAAGCDRSVSQAKPFPAKAIKVIVPFAAGGGSDSFARIIQSAVEDEHLLPEKLVIVNVPGAGGTIGSRRVKHARPDGYTVLLLHEGMMTAQYSGSAAYGAEAFEPIAGSGDATQVIAVRADSAYQDLPDLMTVAADRPDEIIFAANIGAPSHFAGLMLEQAAWGAQFRYTQTGGGAKRFAALQGGHVNVSAFSIAEYVQFRPAGIRALALLGKKRNEEISGLPTATEQGYDVISQNMQFWWAPRGTAADRIGIIADAIEEAIQTPAVREKLAQMRIEPRFVRGDPLEREIQTRSRRLAAVSPTPTQRLPDFASITLFIVTSLAVICWFQRRNRVSVDSDSSRASKSLAATSLSVVLLTIGYVFLLQTTSIGFRVATFGFVVVAGLTLYWGGNPHGRTTRSISAAASTLCLVAVCLSLGVHYLFTQVLVVDLP